MCPSEEVMAALMSGRSESSLERLGAFFSMSPSSGMSVPLAEYVAISASVRPVLKKASGRSPLARIRFFFSWKTVSGRFSHLMWTLVAFSHSFTTVMVL